MSPSSATPEHGTPSPGTAHAATVPPPPPPPRRLERVTDGMQQATNPFDFRLSLSEPGAPTEPGAVEAVTPAAFAPPTGRAVPDPAQIRRSAPSRRIMLVAAAAVATLATTSWIAARSDGGAEASGDAAASTATLDTELGETRDALITTQRLLDEATAEGLDAELRIETLSEELAQARAAEGDADAGAARIAELEAELAVLRTTAATATDDLDALRSELDGARAAISAAQAADLDPADTPEFARYVGELLSSRSGSSRLGQDASRCFGGAVIDIIGLDALGAGQHNAATSEARNQVVDAMQRAAAVCGIDPSLVFG